MKIKSTILLFVCFCSTLFGQKQYPYRTVDFDSIGYTSESFFTNASNLTNTDAIVWKVGGNAVSAHSIIGTNSNYDLIFRTNSTEQLRITAAGVATFTKDININNLRFGNGGAITSNVAVGTFYPNLIDGYYNVGIGETVMEDLTTGYFNLAFGKSAARKITTGYYNVYIGGSSGFNATVGYQNVGIGQSTLYNTTGRENTALGVFSAQTNTTGNWNTAVGSTALYSMTTGNGNTAVGRNAAVNLTTGNYNIAIGFGANVLSNTDNNQLSIGNWLYKNASGNWGFETSSPTANFDFNGSMRVRSLGAYASTDSLVSADANGVLRKTNNPNLYGLSVSAAKTTLSGGLIVDGGNTAYTSGSRLGIFSGYSSPNAGRIFFGDGSGWRMHFSTGSNASPTDLVTIQDNGNMTVSNSVFAAKIGTNTASTASMLYNNTFRFNLYQYNSEIIAPYTNVLQNTTATQPILQLFNSGVSSATYQNLFVHNSINTAMSSMSNGDIALMPQFGAVAMKNNAKRQDFHFNPNSRQNTRILGLTELGADTIQSVTIRDTVGTFRLFYNVGDEADISNIHYTINLPANPQNDCRIDIVIDFSGSTALKSLTFNPNTSQTIAVSSDAILTKAWYTAKFLSDSQGSSGGKWFITKN